MDSGSSCKCLGTAVGESLEAINIAGPFVPSSDATPNTSLKHSNTMEAELNRPDLCQTAKAEAGSESCAKESVATPKLGRSADEGLVG
jgi:hypothetical protein